MASIQIKETDFKSLARLSAEYGISTDTLVALAIEGLIDGAKNGFLGVVLESNTQACG